MNMKDLKHCTKCNRDLFLDNFYLNKNTKDGLSLWCKECQKEYNQQYYQNNQEKIKQQSKEFRESEIGKDYNNKYQKKYNLEHKQEKKIRDKQYRQTENGKKNRNESYIRRVKNGKIAEYERKRKQNDSNYKILCLLRGRINKIIKRGDKSKSTADLLGCSIEQFKEHLEFLFQDGMSWKNQSLKGWHIDHYVPCSYFDLSDPEQQKICFHFLNMQPLWGSENHNKSNILPLNYLEHIQYIKNWIKESNKKIA